ncbi:hypothetical protein PIB30_019373 [Stylosanthes scabra]|uniref:Uncharacterized protein n=1 Tax=Stylosanthes scabra TaxID=79078 RepID=A0ABU6Y8K5_9FABA|nr:hypothetical protein [Stylosanthes scabra]
MSNPNTENEYKDGDGVEALKLDDGETRGLGLERWNLRKDKEEEEEEEKEERGIVVPVPINGNGEGEVALEFEARVSSTSIRNCEACHLKERNIDPERSPQAFPDSCNITFVVNLKEDRFGFFIKFILKGHS